MTVRRRAGKPKKGAVARKLGKKGSAARHQKYESDRALTEERDRILALPEVARGGNAISNDMLYRTTAKVYNASDQPAKISVAAIEYEIPPGESEVPFIVARYLEGYSMSPVYGSYLVSLQGKEGDELKLVKGRADDAFLHHTGNFVATSVTSRAETVKRFEDAGAVPPPPTESEQRAIDLAKKHKGKLSVPSFQA